MNDKEKAIAYDKALERAKLAIKECGDNKGRISMIEAIFPELSESEDEKIRKKIISALNRDKILTEDEAYDCVTWLEKQCQVKESSISQHEIETCKENNDSLTSKDERIRKGLIENFKFFCGDYPETSKWGKDDDLLVKDIIAWLEKQGELTQSVTKTSDRESSAHEDIELNRFEGALFTAFSYAWQQYLDGEKVNPAQWAKDNSSELLEAALEEYKPSWSEEDSKMFNTCCDFLTVEECVWLKSIKERMGGK